MSAKTHAEMAPGEYHAWAAANLRTMQDRGPCRIERIDWPYDCIARTEHPDHVVYGCETHLAWWHEPPASA